MCVCVRVFACHRLCVPLRALRACGGGREGGRCAWAAKCCCVDCGQRGSLYLSSLPPSPSLCLSPALSFVPLLSLTSPTARPRSRSTAMTCRCRTHAWATSVSSSRLTSASAVLTPAPACCTLRSALRYTPERNTLVRDSSNVEHGVPCEAVPTLILSAAVHAHPLLLSLLLPLAHVTHTRARTRARAHSNAHARTNIATYIAPPGREPMALAGVTCRTRPRRRFSTTRSTRLSKEL